MTEDEIDKYKKDQIERYQQQQKENEELLKQIKEGKVVPPTSSSERRPTLEDNSRGTVMQTINQGFQEASEDQKKQQNEKLKKQIMYLQVRFFFFE